MGVSDTAWANHYGFDSLEAMQKASKDAVDRGLQGLVNPFGGFDNRDQYNPDGSRKDGSGGTRTTAQTTSQGTAPTQQVVEGTRTRGSPSAVSKQSSVDLRPVKGKRSNLLSLD